MSALQWATIEDAIQAWITAGSGLASDHVIWAQQTSPRPTGEFISMRMTVLQENGRDWLDRYDNIVSVPTLAIASVNTGAGTLTITAHGLTTGRGPLAFGGTPPAPLTLLTNYWPVVIDANTIKLASTFQNAVAAVPVTLALSSGGTTPTLSGTPTTTTAGQEISQRARGPRRGVLTLQCFAGAPTGGAPTGTTSPEAILHDAVTSYVLDSINAGLVTAGVGVAGFDPIQSIDGVVNTTRFEPRAVTTVHLHLASELVETSTYIEIVNTTTGLAVGTSTTKIAIVDGIVKFLYIATGTEGSDFFVAMPAPRSTSIYIVEAFFNSGAFNVGFNFPNAGGDRTTTAFHVQTTHALTAGDVIQFEVE